VVIVDRPENASEHLEKTLEVARDLAKGLREKGLGIEADLILLALDVGSAAASKQGEVYRHSLISLHDIACDRLDQLEEAEQKPNEGPPRTVSRLN
jgi:hypothetical protein